MAPKLRSHCLTKAAQRDGLRIACKKRPANNVSQVARLHSIPISCKKRPANVASQQDGIRISCEKRPANVASQTSTVTSWHSCTKCGVYPRSQRDDVLQGQCCNRCPNHGAWCTSHGRTLQVSSQESMHVDAHAQPLAIVSQQLCANCGVFPRSWRHEVCQDQCCNNCPNHGPWCTRNDWSIAASRACPMSTFIFRTEDLAQAKAHLAEEGWAVIGPIFDSDLKQLRYEFWRDISSIPGFPKGSPIDQFDTLPSGTCGYLVRGNNLPNSRFAWAVRLNPRIRNIFASIYEEEPSSMCTAMDAIFFAVKGRAVVGLPLHRDAEAENTWCSFSKATLSIQGIFSLTPTFSADDGGTVLVPKSHLMINELGRKLPLDEQMRRRAECIRPTVPENHLLVFNSRTIHGSTPPLRDRPDGINRLAVPVQFMPKSRRSDQTLQRKRAAYLEGSGSRAKPDDSFRKMEPDRHELAWSSQHGYPHKKCRLLSRLVNGKIPDEIDAVF